MQKRPTTAELKSSYILWAQYVDANCRPAEFEAMTEARKDSWLSILKISDNAN